MSVNSPQPLPADRVCLAVHPRTEDGLVHGVICVPARLWSAGVRRRCPMCSVANEVGGALAETRCGLLSTAKLRRDDPARTRTVTAAIMLRTLSAGCCGAVDCARHRLRLSPYALPTYPSALTARKV